MLYCIQKCFRELMHENSLDKMCSNINDLQKSNNHEIDQSTIDLSITFQRFKQRLHVNKNTQNT